jgi:hypothetical protein
MKTSLCDDLTAVPEEKYMTIRWCKAATSVPFEILNYHQIKLMPHFANPVSIDLHQPTKYIILPKLQF